MVQRFFFNGVNCKAAGATIAGHNDLVILILPDKAKAALVFMHFAESGTQIALYATIFQCVPIAGFYGVIGNKISHYFSPGYA
jgi:hypothetical protein